MSDARFDPMTLPSGLPEPLDDGAADHLLGSTVPDIALLATDGRRVSLAKIRGPRVVVYAYPRTGRPGEAPLVDDWDQIPGARGCTPETCGFRDHHADMNAAGAEVFGLSTQDTEYQQELVERLHLPFAVLSDADLELTRAWKLPAFEVAGQTLLRRLTLVIRDGKVEHVWYPVFPPDRHAEEVLAWLRSAPAS
ncbi:MAG TPA: peroxiredoxin [Candidatus Dormibacteraeota bacterium]|nr:peroxiredoxin [Candidatus Dormibacteraeota bacterium]